MTEGEALYGEDAAESLRSREEARKRSDREKYTLLTKDWALGTAMESIEMRETYNVFEEAAVRRTLERAGLAVREWIVCASIDEDLGRLGAERIGGAHWFRKFLAVAERIPTDREIVTK